MKYTRIDIVCDPGLYPTRQDGQNLTIVNVTIELGPGELMVIGEEVAKATTGKLAARRQLIEDIVTHRKRIKWSLTPSDWPEV